MSFTSWTRENINRKLSSKLSNYLGRFFSTKNVGYIFCFNPLLITQGSKRPFNHRDASADEKNEKNTRKDVNNLQMIENDEDGKLKPSYILNIKDKDTRNKSINNLMISAKEGNIHSQYNLGLMYLKGIGIQQDCDKAVYYLQLAAKSRAKQSVGETNSEIPQMHDRGPMRQAITLEDQNSQAKSNCNVEYLYNQHFDYWLEQIAVENQKKTNYYRFLIY